MAFDHPIARWTERWHLDPRVAHGVELIEVDGLAARRRVQPDGDRDKPKRQITFPD